MRFRQWAKSHLTGVLSNYLESTFQAIQSWVSNAVDYTIFRAVITDLGNSYPKNRVKQPQPHRKTSEAVQGVAAAGFFRNLRIVFSQSVPNLESTFSWCLLAGFGVYAWLARWAFWQGFWWDFLA